MQKPLANRLERVIKNACMRWKLMVYWSEGAKLTNGSLCGSNHISRPCEPDRLQFDWQPGATTTRFWCLILNQNRKQRPMASENYPVQAVRQAQNSFASEISLFNRQKQLHAGQNGSLADLPLQFWLASQIMQAACYTIRQWAPKVADTHCTQC